MSIKYIPSDPQWFIQDHLKHNANALLCVGCGLGKTAASLDAVNQLYEDGATKGILVVAPKRVCTLTWPDEVAKWNHSSWMTVADLRTPKGKQALLDESAHIYIINYEQLQQLGKWYCFNRDYRKYGFDTVIWDEITYAKNHKSKRIRAVRGYFRRPMKRQWGLTGTPAPNGLLDLFGQVLVLDGGERLGKSYTKFQQAFFEPTDYMEYNWVPKADGRERLYAQLGDLALTLKSSDWLDIPDLDSKVIDVALPPDATKDYKELEKEFIVALRTGGDILAQNAAVLLGKLIQLTSGQIYDEDKVVHHVHDAKLKALKKAVTKKSPPTMVICNFIHEQDTIRQHFPQAVFWADAKTDAKQIRLRDQWNAGKVKMLIAHPRSIGHGLNMQDGGSRLIWTTLPWERDLYDQTIARLARRGQLDAVEVLHLICSSTIDEFIFMRLGEKEDEQNLLLDGLRKHYAT